MDINLNLLFILCPLIFTAGFIDSIAGGGGLISLTSYMACGIPGTMALGTNKFSSFAGGTFSSINYIRTKNYDIPTLIGAFVAALAGSWIGSECSLLIDEKIFSILLLCATPVVAVLAILDKDYSGHEREMPLGKSVLLCIGIGLAVGFYDGFYGPGAGMFTQMGFIMIAGLSVKKACGNARMINWASNIAALLNFVRTGNVLYRIAIPCAVCSIAGNLIGSRLAIKKDVKIVRPMMIVVVILLFVKILIDII
ncbi:MAG: sulfite exporter TauE/SafE family protein [Sphaerochaeta sp.]